MFPCGNLRRPGSHKIAESGDAKVLIQFLDKIERRFAARRDKLEGDRHALIRERDKGVGRRRLEFRKPALAGGIVCRRQSEQQRITDEREACAGRQLSDEFAVLAFGGGAIAQSRDQNIARDDGD